MLTNTDNKSTQIEALTGIRQEWEHAAEVGGLEKISGSIG